MRLTGLLFICVFLFVNMCQGRIAVAAAVSFSEMDFGENENPNEWSQFEGDIPVISQRYKRKMKPINEKRFYCGINIDCSSHVPNTKKHSKDFRIRRL